MTTEPSFADKTPLSVYKEFFRKYFSFSGRASRYDYWAFYFMNFMVYLAFFVLSFINETFSILSTIYGVFIIIPSLALGIRRLHDINKSGWYLAIPLAVCLLFAVIAAVRAAANYAAGAPATGGFYAVVYTILFLVALYATFIYILYLFSKKAVNEGNRFGEVTEAPEYEGLSRKYLIFGWVMIIVFPILSVAIISAYSSSVTTYKANKTLDEVAMMVMNTRAAFSKQKGYVGLNNKTAKMLEIVPADMYPNPEDACIINPFGGNVDIYADGDSFFIRYNRVPTAACKKITGFDFEGEGFINYKVNGVINGPCNCAEQGCVIEWNFY